MNALITNRNSEPDYRRLELLSCLSRPQAGNSTSSVRRIVLAALSHDLPEPFIGESLARKWVAETGQAVLWLQLCDAAGAEGKDLPELGASTFNGTHDLSRHLEALDTGVERLMVRVTGGARERGHLAAILEFAAGSFRNVLVQVCPEGPEPVWRGCVEGADNVYLLIRQSTEHLYRLNLLLHDLPARQVQAPRIKPVLCLASGEEAHGFHHAIREVNGTLQNILHDCPPRGETTAISHVFDADLRHLAREIGRCRIGLALSSGGAKGLAHIGVIQVLEENGIEIDVVTGSSMGAYVASIWAHGHDGTCLEKLAREVEGRWGLLHLLDPIFPPRQGFLRGLGVKQRLMRTIGEAHFSDLATPLRVTATQQNTFERVVFDSGEVATAVHASSAIPGVCVPVQVGNECFIDGGITDPLPVDVLREMGVERVIAVNTLPTPAFLRCSLELERELEASRPRRFPALRWLNKYINYFARGNILDSVLNCVHGAQMQVAEASCRKADVVLRPLAGDGYWHDFTRPAKYIAIGRRIAEEHLEELKTLVKRRTYEPAHLNRPMEVAA
jgi:NTE family protein